MITPRHRNIALLVAGCYFMEMLDGTIVTTASPQIGRSLHAPATSVGLVVTAYLLTLAVLIPLSGWLTRRYGNRVVFLTAIALFTLASVGCAASVNLGMLVAMRVLQGAGGAMMVPVGRTMVLSPAAKEDILRLTSFVVWPGLLAPVIAPLAGGLITTYATWHWMFLINVPLGLVAFAVAWRLVTTAAAAGEPPPLDWAGVVLTCAGLGGLTYAAHLLTLPEPPAAQTAAFGVVSVALLAGAVAHLRRAAHPLLNLRTLSVRTFRVSQLGGTMYFFVVGAMPFLLPLLFQTQFGWSPVKSGALTAFVFAGNVGIKPATTPLINRFGFRPLLIASTLGTAGLVAALGFTTASTPLWLIAAALSGQRYHPVDRVHRVQHGGAGGHAARADARRQHARRHVDAARRRSGDRGRHRGAAGGRRGHRRRPARVHRGVLRARPGRGRVRGRGAAARPGRRKRRPAAAASPGRAGGSGGRPGRRHRERRRVTATVAARPGTPRLPQRVLPRPALACTARTRSIGRAGPWPSLPLARRGLSASPIGRSCWSRPIGARGQKLFAGRTKRCALGVHAIPAGDRTATPTSALTQFTVMIMMVLPML